MIQRKTPLRKASPKRAEELALYRQERDVWLAEHPVCSILLALYGCTYHTQELHHFRGRNGSLLRDKRFWMPVCKACHAYLHAHPTFARESGYLASATDFNRSQKE